MIESNDPLNSKAKFSITGDVERFVKISPAFVRLFGKPGDTLKSAVKIIQEEKYPFSIISSRAINGKLIRFQVEKLKDGKSRGYLLNIENLKTDPGNAFETIILKTDSKVQPEIRLKVHIRLMDPAAAQKKSSMDKSNPFLNIIKQMEKDKASDGKKQTTEVDPEKAREMKKKFEELIKASQKVE